MDADPLSDIFKLYDEHLKNSYVYQTNSKRMNTTISSPVKQVEPTPSVGDKSMSHQFGSIRVERRLITPEYAEDLLKRNTINRKINKQYVVLLAHEMREGRFRLTHQGISVDANGCLQDGQHRLAAIVKSGIPQEFFIFWNAPTDNMIVLDSNKVRNSSDTLQQAGHVNTQTLASACTILISHKQNNARAMSGGGGRINTKATREVILQFVENNRSIIDSVEAGIKASKGKTKGLSPSYLSSYHWIFSQVDKEKANEFFELYETQENLPVNHPIYMLNDLLNKDYHKRADNRGTTLTPEVKDRYFRIAWNLFIAGASTSKLKLSKNTKEPICDATGSNLEKELFQRLK